MPYIMESKRPQCGKQENTQLRQPSAGMRDEGKSNTKINISSQDNSTNKQAMENARKRKI